MTREDINDIINAICPNDEDYEKSCISPKYLRQELEQLSLDQKQWIGEPTTKNDLGVDTDKLISDCEKMSFDIEFFNKPLKVVSLDAVKNIVKDLPLITSQELRWIPVSERLPKEDTDVLVTLKCGLIGIMQKKLADDDNGESCYIWQDFEGEEHEVIAWMPLPKAYREVEE